MSKKPREALDAYYAQADSWARDRTSANERSRRIAWLVAGAATVVAICEAVALTSLIPLKTVEPYTLMVDRQTGYVQLLKPLQPEQVSADRALTQSFLVQYVIAREGFDIGSLDTDYRKVALWSANTARSDYLAKMPVSNPESPLILYPRTTQIEVRVKSVSPVGRDTAMVRFETRRRDAGAQAGLSRPWVAIVRYRYSGEPMKVEDRFINPLGFQVIQYRVNAEAIEAVESTPDLNPVLITPNAQTPGPPRPAVQ